MATFLLRALALATAYVVTLAASPTLFILSGSRFWHNYRHSSNALVFYAAARRLGVRDDAIALFLPAAHASDARNVARGGVVNGDGDAARGDVEGEWPGSGRASAPVEVDFADAAATPAALLRALRGRSGGNAPVLSGGPLLVMLTGHGGDGFLKFHDKEELSYADLGAALAAAGVARRYSSLLVVADTCQAASVTLALEAAHVPRGIVIASSEVGENSYAVGFDDMLALAVSDLFSREAAYMLQRASTPPNKKNWTNTFKAPQSLARLCAAPGGPPEDIARACGLFARSRAPARVEASLGWRNAADGAHAKAVLSTLPNCGGASLGSGGGGAGMPVAALIVSHRSRNTESKVSVVAIGQEEEHFGVEEGCSIEKDLSGMAADTAAEARTPLLRYFAGSDDVAVV